MSAQWKRDPKTRENRTRRRLTPRFWNYKADPDKRAGQKASPPPPPAPQKAAWPRRHGTAEGCPTEPRPEESRGLAAAGRPLLLRRRPAAQGCVQYFIPRTRAAAKWLPAGRPSLPGGAVGARQTKPGWGKEGAVRPGPPPAAAAALKRGGGRRGRGGPGPRGRGGGRGVAGRRRAALPRGAAGHRAALLAPCPGGVNNGKSTYLSAAIARFAACPYPACRWAPAQAFAIRKVHTGQLGNVRLIGFAEGRSFRWAAG